MSLLSNAEQLKRAIVEIPPNSPDYPKEWLKEKTPLTCYAVGNIRLLKERKLAIVGSRRTGAGIMKIGANIAEELSPSFVIVTGTADGGDSAAIEGGLRTGRIICVLAGGFSALPQGNLSLLERVAKEGLLLSPYPYETEVRPFSYGHRNRLLASLAEGVLLLSAGDKSGALMTVDYAREQGKKVFALPYAPNTPTGSGCNAVIKRGGYLAENAQDIANEFGVDLTQNTRKIDLSEDEGKLYEALREITEGHLAEISERAGIPFFKARALLSALEIKGLAVSLGGNRYAAV